MSNAPDLFDITAAISDAIDRHALKSGGRTDLGEMGQMAAVETLRSLVERDLPSLFTPSTEEVQAAIGRFASGQRFSELAREFVARLTYRSLDYFLSRELASHTGADRSFATDAARSAFDEGLRGHYLETSRIIKEFAGGWYGKQVYQKGGLTPDAVHRFIPVALKKTRAELGKRRDAVV